MMTGNGTLKKKMAAKDTAASVHMTSFLSDFLPMRSTAPRTMASTAGFKPSKTAATSGTLPHVA